MSSQEKKIARVVGALFLIAMAASLVGAGFIESALGNPDFLSADSVNETQVVGGALLELLNGISVLGIGVLMFPIFKRYNEGLALGYTSFRIIEAMIIIAAMISPLMLLAFRQEYSGNSGVDTTALQTIGSAFMALRVQLTGSILGIFFSLGALIFYYLLFHSKIVPRFISIWGLIAAALILTWNLLELVGISVPAGLVLALPIILNEIFLGFWLIIRGFDFSEVVLESAELAY